MMCIVKLNKNFSNYQQNVSNGQHIPAVLYIKELELRIKRKSPVVLGPDPINQVSSANLHQSCFVTHRRHYGSGAVTPAGALRIQDPGWLVTGLAYDVFVSHLVSPGMWLDSLVGLKMLPLLGTGRVWG